MDLQTMNELPLVSVIVPIYNVEKYLDRCVESIVNQSYSNLEIILVDDGSPDGCPQKCDTWAKKDNRITVVHQKNRGAAGARNTGIDIATGDFIGFVDPDDYIYPNMYEVMVNDAKLYAADLIIIGAEKVYDDGTKHYVGPGVGTMVLSSSQAFQYINLPGYFDIAPWSKMGRSDLFKGLRFPVEEKTSEDYPVAFSLLARSKKIIYNSDPYYAYCQHAGTLSHYVSDAKYRFTKEMLSFVKAHYPESAKYALYGHVIAAIAVYDTILANGERDSWRNYEKEIIHLVHQAYPIIKSLIPSWSARWIQLTFFKFFPVLYRYVFPLYKKINKKTVD